MKENKEIIALLKENNRILNEINEKVSQGAVMGVSVPALSREMMISLAEQYQQNPDILIQENAIAHVRGGNLFVSSPQGRVNINLSEKDLKSSFIKSVSQKGRKLIVSFKSGKSYQYTSQDTREFNRVAELMLTSTYVSKPFLNHLRNNDSFNFEVL